MNGAVVAELLKFGMAMIDEIQAPHQSRLPDIADERIRGPYF